MNNDNELMQRLKMRLKEEEGKRLEAYKPDKSEEHFTIGYGHYGPDVKPGQKISEQEAEDLLEMDISTRLGAIRSAIPKYDSLPASAKEALFSSWYRGSLSGSPATISLINEGKFEEASKEFLNNKEYRDRKSGKRQKLPGVLKRMEHTSEELKKLKKPKLEDALLPIKPEENKFMKILQDENYDLVAQYLRRPNEK